MLSGSLAWLACSGILALGALFRGFENALRFRGHRLRASLGWVSVVMAAWAGLSVLQGQLAGFAWIGLCLIGSAESVLAKGLEQGGSDPMTLWMRAFVASAAYATESGLQILSAFGVSLLLASYVCAGLGKARSSSWWNGRAIEAYLARPCYDLAQLLTERIPGFCYRYLGIGVLGFELLAPGVLISSSLLYGWVIVGVIFHSFNVVLFGLHRFFWTWTAAYPLLFSL